MGHGLRPATSSLPGDQRARFVVFEFYYGNVVNVRYCWFATGRVVSYTLIAPYRDRRTGAPPAPFGEDVEAQPALAEDTFSDEESDSTVDTDDL